MNSCPQFGHSLSLSLSPGREEVPGKISRLKTLINPPGISQYINRFMSKPQPIFRAKMPYIQHFSSVLGWYKTDSACPSHQKPSS